MTTLGKSAQFPVTTDDNVHDSISQLLVAHTASSLGSHTLSYEAFYDPIKQVLIKKLRHPAYLIDKTTPRKTTDIDQELHDIANWVLTGTFPPLSVIKYVCGLDEMKTGILKEPEVSNELSEQFWHTFISTWIEEIDIRFRSECVNISTGKGKAPKLPYTYNKDLSILNRCTYMADAISNFWCHLPFNTISSIAAELEVPQVFKSNSGLPSAWSRFVNTYNINSDLKHTVSNRTFSELIEELSGSHHYEPGLLKDYKESHGKSRDHIQNDAYQEKWSRASQHAFEEVRKSLYLTEGADESRMDAHDKLSAIGSTIKMSWDLLPHNKPNSLTTHDLLLWLYHKLAENNWEMHLNYNEILLLLQCTKGIKYTDHSSSWILDDFKVPARRVRDHLTKLEAESPKDLEQFDKKSKRMLHLGQLNSLSEEINKIKHYQFFLEK